MMKALIIPKSNSDRIQRITDYIVRQLSQQNCTALVKQLPQEPVCHEQISDLADIDVALVLGGDGTILRSLNILYNTSVPIIGVNAGHLGFLTEAELDDLDQVLQAVIDNKYQVEKRSVLATNFIASQNGCSSDNNTTYSAANWAINEVVLSRSTMGHMVNLGVSIDNSPLTTYACDGTLISTATGSTAYAFSAGGPILWPNVDAMLLLPLAAHTLFNKPLIVGRDTKIKITVLPTKHTGKDETVTVSCDGSKHFTMHEGDCLEVFLATWQANFARIFNNNFTERLVHKFNLPNKLLHEK